MRTDSDNKKPFVIAEHAVEKLRGMAASAEEKGRLVPEQLSMIYDQKWFKMFIPKRFGGLGLSLPEGVRLEEELANIDGSLGWTVTLCSGANLFIGYIDQSIASSVFMDPRVCLGGSGQASGRAVIKDGGYEVTGKWRYATGSPHNTYFTANCIIEQNGKPLLGQDTQPLVKSFFFAAKDVHIVEDWNTFGLKATASHSFEIDRLWVDERHTFLISPEHATLDCPVYRYPFVPFAEATLAVNTLGMARNFLSCCHRIIGHHEQYHELLAMADGQVRKTKDSFYEVLDNSWDELLKTGKVSENMVQAVGSLSRALVKVSREQVMLLYPYCGIAAADASTTINRVWRDIFTASQHRIFRE